MATLEMSPNLEASTGGQIGTDGNELQGIATSRGVGANRKRRSTSPEFTSLTNSAGCNHFNLLRPSHPFAPFARQASLEQAFILLWNSMDSMKFCVRLPVNAALVVHRDEQRKTWSGRRGSNPQPTAWEAATLPLSYSRSASRVYRKTSVANETVRHRTQLLRAR